MKETPFTDIHTRLGAKMVDFAGFRMPVEYTGIKNEHMAVRTKVGVFDVSHMGEIWVRGRFALDFIQYVTSNDASKLKPGQIQYSCFTNGKGGIVDDLLVYCFSNESYLLVVNASNTERL
jgi:aminomethyltransferase